jgi:FkbM family methyltransferase
MYENFLVNDIYNINCSYEPSIIIDGGAHVGMTTIYFANRFPNAKIYSIEPNIENYKLLVKNTFYYNVTAINAALWNKLENVSIFDNGKDDKDVCFHIRKNKTSKKEVAKINTITVPCLMSLYNITHIDILKMNIEGSEIEVLESSPEWIDKISSIIVEEHDRFREGCTETINKYTKDFSTRWKHNDLWFLSKNNYFKI